MLTAALLPLFFIGDIPWINDEPKFIAIALQANARGELATHGLLGTVGVSYGPAAGWLYQALLFFTHDLVMLAFIHAALLRFGLLIALFWLARTLDLSRPFILVILCSPYLWFYDRTLWDNTLLIPLSALAIAAFASYRVHARPAALVAALLCIAPMPLIHPMALALAIPLAAHLMILARRHWLWFVLTTASVSAVLIGVAWPYLQSLWQLHPAPHHGNFASGFFFPLLGGQLLTAVGFHFVWWGPLWWRIGAWLTAPGLALTFIGMFLAAQQARASASPRRTLCRLAIAVLAAQALLDGFAHAFYFPHYFNATWIVFAFFAWSSLDSLGAWRMRWVHTQAATLAAFLLFCIADIHRHHGNRDLHYGSTLANQVEVAKAAQAYAPAPTTNVALLLTYPQAWDVLRALYPPRADAAPSTPHIVYASGDALDGELALAPP